MTQSGQAVYSNVTIDDLFDAPWRQAFVESGWMCLCYRKLTRFSLFIFFYSFFSFHTILFLNSFFQGATRFSKINTTRWVTNAFIHITHTYTRASNVIDTWKYIFKIFIKILIKKKKFPLFFSVVGWIFFFYLGDLQ